MAGVRRPPIDPKFLRYHKSGILVTLQAGKNEVVIEVEEARGDQLAKRREAAGALFGASPAQVLPHLNSLSVAGGDGAAVSLRTAS